MTTDLDLLHSRMTEIIEQSAQVLSTLTTCDGQPHATELHHSQARALDDAYRVASATAARTQSIDAILASLAPRRKEENND